MSAYVRSLTFRRILELATRPEGLWIHRFRETDERPRNRVFRLLRDKKLYRADRQDEWDLYRITKKGREALANKETKKWLRAFTKKLKENASTS